MKITLSDSRTLAYAEYGDPRGKPVFFFHGTPGSRSFRPPDEVTTKSGVRLICVERPGYGDSTFQPNRQLLDWPMDIAQLANSVGIEKFAVVGHSGGGPHTLACAYALPERVTRAVVVSGACPVDAPNATDGMIAANRFGFRFGRYVPWSLGKALLWWIYRERFADPAKVMDRETGRRPRADDELIAKPEIRQICLLSEQEAYRPGILGFAWDVRLITRPWGFSLKDIKVPVHFWHGTQDTSTSIAMARFMASEIPNAKLIVCEGEAHLLLFPHWEEILSACRH